MMLVDFLPTLLKGAFVTLEATVLSGQVVARQGLTPYAAQGDRLPQACLALLLLAMLWGGPRPRRSVLGS